MRQANKFLSGQVGTHSFSTNCALPCKWSKAKQARLKMRVLAYIILHMIRYFYVWDEEVKQSVEYPIKRLIKEGGRISYLTRQWHVNVAAAFPLAHDYWSLLAWGP